MSFSLWDICFGSISKAGVFDGIRFELIPSKAFRIDDDSLESKISDWSSSDISGERIGEY